jgi:hypothetical protein
LSEELISARIHDAKLITQSDHNIVKCLLYTKELIRNHHISQNKRYGNKRHIYHYDKMKEEDWTKYTGNLEKRFKNKAKDIDNTFKLMPSQQNIDKIWKIIKTNINQCANKNIPHTLTSSNRNVIRQRKTELRPSEYIFHLKSLRKLINKAKRNLNKNISELKFIKAQGTIKAFNKFFSTILTLIDKYWTQEWIAYAKNCWKESNKVSLIEAKQFTNTLIQKRIEERASMIVTNQRWMINSLLSKEIKSIKIDELIIATESNEKILLTESEDILREASNQFVKLKKKRKHNFDNISPEWAKIYAPLAHILDEIYEGILDSLIQEEWIMALCIIKTP